MADKKISEVVTDSGPAEKDVRDDQAPEPGQASDAAEAAGETTAPEDSAEDGTTEDTGNTTDAEAEDAATPDEAAAEAEDTATSSAALQDSEDLLPEEPDPAPAETAPASQTIVEKRGGFGMAFLGGLVAAGLGFAAGQGQLLDPLLPAGLKSKGAQEIAALEQAQAALSDRLAALSAQVEANQMPDLSAVTGQIDSLAAGLAPLADGWAGTQDRLDGLGSDVAALQARLSDLEKRPVAESVSPDAIAAYEAELEKLGASLAQQRAEVEQMVAEAQAMDAAAAEAARIAAAQTTVARLRSALDAGTAIGALLIELKDLGVDAPEALAAARDGVETHGALSESFAPAARQALAAAREDTKGTGGLLAYMERHLGARSVAPREGDDPDAVLSRAEAAAAAGDLDAALAEIEALPAPARDALAGWENAARTRAAALAAADELAKSLIAN